MSQASTLPNNEAPPHRRGVTARLGILDSGGERRLVGDPWFEIDERGTIVVAHAGPPDERDRPELVYDLGESVIVPGMVNAHSHAFQRAIRGRTHRRGAHDPSSFWSWREAMYSVASSLDPDEVREQTRRCFAEMLGRGITCVGEFHYLHHERDGTPYEDPDELSRAIVAAAHEVGIRLCLLEVYYARAGSDAAPLPEQRRFCDATVEDFLARVDRLRQASPEASPRHYRVGVAPHSVRAVPHDDLEAIAAHANTHALPIHAHVSEQVAENEACDAEYGLTPAEVFARTGCMQRPRAFTAVHAIHVRGRDVELLSGQNVCACPSTEADLGDGVIKGSVYARAGTNLALGSDSNSIIDLVQEARLLEMHERLSSQSRLCLADDKGQVGRVLLDAATIGGATSLGWPELGSLCVGAPFDAVAIDRHTPALRDVDDAFVLDALMLSGTATDVLQVWVAGRRRI